MPENLHNIWTCVDVKDKLNEKENTQMGYIKVFLALPLNEAK